jgi:hypothetical protein
MQSIRERKAMIGLLLSQHLQVWPIDVVHEQIRALLCVVFKDAIDTRQRGMIEALQHLAFKGETLALFFIIVN